MLEAEANTLVMVTLEGGPGRREMTAVVLPPPSWTLPGPGTRAAGAIRASDIALALQQISESDGTKSVPLPGLPSDDGEPEAQEQPVYESDLDRWLEANPLPELPKFQPSGPG